MATRPVRLRLSRRKGFDLQAVSREANGLPALRVSRPGPWGNPFSIDEMAIVLGVDHAAAQAEAVARYRRWVDGDPELAEAKGVPPSRAEISDALSGRNLACWCAPGTPCHADVLIALAAEAETED